MNALVRPYESYKNSGEFWLDDIPQSWSCRQLKYVVTLSREKSVPHSSLKYVGMENIRSNDGSYVDTEEQTAEGPSVLFQKNDVLFGKLRPYLAKSWLASFSGICSSEFLVLKALDVDPRFLNYLTLSREFVLVVNSSTYGAKMPRASWDFIGMLKVPVPDHGSSAQIANFLDHETAKIDALIEKQKQLIALITEKRQAIISHAVTKGLDPDAPMQDSGVEWLGEVPAHWDTINVRNMVRAGSLVIQDGNHGELHPVATEYVDDGIPFLMASNIRGGSVSLENCNHLTKERADKLRIGFAKPGDLLLTHKGTVGEVALIPDEIETDYWMLTPQVTYYRWLKNKYCNRYFFYYFQASAIFEQLKCIGEKQSTRSYVGLMAQRDLEMLVPSRLEQDEIVQYLDTQIEKFDSLAQAAEQMNQTLGDRRTALISAAVTGKIDVRDWKAPTSARKRHSHER